MVGWNTDVDASALGRLWDDKWLLTAAGAGGGAGALLAWAFSDRTAGPVAGAGLGLVPALIKASQFVTDLY